MTAPGRRGAAIENAAGAAKRRTEKTKMNLRSSPAMDYRRGKSRIFWNGSKQAIAKKSRRERF
jgi:hypothetical protein